MDTETCAAKADDALRADLAPPHVAVAGNDLWLFVELDPLVAAMVADIRQARERVWLESYIIADDSIGQLVAAALAERAQAGVDVRVIYDAIGSQSTASAFFTQLQASGVKVQSHHTIWETLFQHRSWTQLNRRNHRKTLVIDDWGAYFGGMNIIDPIECAQEGPMYQPPSAAGWRDVHVRLVGPQVARVAESFERSWRREHHLPIRQRSRAYRQGMLPSGVFESIRFFDSGPGRKQSRASQVFARLMRNARQEILLSMAYFIPAGRVLRELLRARKRGVRIRVVVPSDNDVKLVQYALNYLYSKLLKRGIEIYERQKCMLHSKAMVIDEIWSVVGSCNLDPRSLEMNYEFLAAIRSTDFARELRAICENEIANSRRVTLDDCQRRSWSQRVLDRLAYGWKAWL